MSDTRGLSRTKSLRARRRAEVSRGEAELDVFAPRLVQIYGQGETPMTMTALPK